MCNVCVVCNVVVKCVMCVLVCNVVVKCVMCMQCVMHIVKCVKFSALCIMEFVMKKCLPENDFNAKETGIVKQFNKKNSNN